VSGPWAFCDCRAPQVGNAGGASLAHAYRVSKRWGTRRTGWSVRSRILATILVVAALGLIAAGGTAFLVGRQVVITNIDQRLTAQVAEARLLALGAGGEGEFTTTRDALERIVAQVVPDRHASSLGILAGRPAFVPSVAVAFDMPANPDFVDRILAEVSDGSVRLGTASTTLGDLRYIAAPVAIDDERGVFVLAVDLHAELADYESATIAYAGVSAGVLLIIGLVGWLVAGRLLAPVRRLRLAAEDITATDRGARIPVIGHDDVSALTSTVNDMLDRLDAALTSQRRLLDDVRHELKTPITIVRGHLELLDAADPSEVESTRMIAIDELDRMSGLIDEIEVLAESRLMVTRRVPVHAGELGAEVFAKARGMSGHRWHSVVDADSIVSVDRAKIVQAWLQLVDNAIKYSPPGSSIIIGVNDFEGAVEFWVQDAGPGIPRGAEQTIFDRHARVGQDEVAGSGLGLSIVRSIVTAHAGRVAVLSTSAGTRIGFVLPVAAAAAPAPAQIAVSV
jgi:two-component system, OmpR family, sensor kinase